MNATDHYRVPTPFVVSFSGGRTSAFLLRKIADAYGSWPERDALAVFANTGREHPATLDFVQRCSTEWGIPLAWVERNYAAPEGFTVVDHATAKRNGEPFEGMITKKNWFLPNPMMRICTSELKVVPIAMYAKSVGITEGTVAVGLRADEPRRAHKVHGSVRQGFDYVCPMYRAGHTLADVTDFWKRQAFDLRLPNDDKAFGNCDGCFLKGRGLLERVIEHDPQRMEWWADMEERAKHTFRNDRANYRQMLVQVSIQGRLFDQSQEENESISCTCTD